MRVPSKPKRGADSTAEGNVERRAKVLEIFAPVIKQFFTILFIALAAFVIVRVNLLRDIVSIIKLKVSLPGNVSVEVEGQEASEKATGLAIQAAQNLVQKADSTDAIKQALEAISGAGSRSQ